MCVHFPAAPHLIRRSPPPCAVPRVSHHRTALDSQAQPVVGVGGHKPPPAKEKPGQTQKVPPQAAPLTHRSGYCWGNWHLLPRLGNRCRRRRKCAAYSFLHWRKRSSGPTIDLVYLPLPFIAFSVLLVLFLLQFLPRLLASFLPSARFVSFPLESKHLNCSGNTN